MGIAGLLQPARSVDLVRRHPRRPGRPRLAQRPAAAHASAGNSGAECDRRPLGGLVMALRLLFAAVLLTVLGGPSARAVEPSERLADPVLEARARTLSQELR